MKCPRGESQHGLCGSGGGELRELWPQNHTLFRPPPFPGPVALGALGARSLKPNSLLEGLVCLLPEGRTESFRKGSGRLPRARSSARLLTLRACN